jgi:hypothetical protein
MRGLGAARIHAHVSILRPRVMRAARRPPDCKRAVGHGDAGSPIQFLVEPVTRRPVCGDFCSLASRTSRAASKVALCAAPLAARQKQAARSYCRTGGSLGGASANPPPARGRSTCGARRVGVVCVTPTLTLPLSGEGIRPALPPFARASRDAEPVETPRRRRRFPPASPATEPATPQVGGNGRHLDIFS